MDLVNKIGFGLPLQLYNFILSNVKDIFLFHSFTLSLGEAIFIRHQLHVNCSENIL